MVNPGKGKELKAHIRSELERGVKPVTLAESTNVPKNTIRRWRRNLERHGSMDALPSGNTGRAKSLTTEQEHYLLGYLHGRPDAHLTEMRRVLKEAFDIDVSLPTISRTLKTKGCMKGFNKTRQIHTATKVTLGHDQRSKSHPDWDSAQPSGTVQDSQVVTSAVPISAFVKDLERQLEQQLGQDRPDGVVSNTPPLEHATDTGSHQYRHRDSTQGQVQDTNHNILTAVAQEVRTASVEGNTNAIIDPALD